MSKLLLTDSTKFYAPSHDFAIKANLSQDKYNALCQKANEDYVSFWGDLAHDKLSWKKNFSQTLNDKAPPFYKWFEDGLLNISYNCLDRHLTTNPNKTAIIFEADDGKTDSVSYSQLHKRVCQFANGLKAIGVKKGDRVVIYLPHSIEAIVAMQAIVRIGAIHSVVFAGFSAKALAERIMDAESEYVITVDGFIRGAKQINLKDYVDEALQLLKDKKLVRHIVVQNRVDYPCKMVDKRDIWWHELIKLQPNFCDPEWVGSEHPLFILYTSGSTGTPKGVQHSSAGYLLGTIVTMEWVFDYKDSDCFWCTADVGWITGHSYVCYGPLAMGATQVIFDGIPTYPNPARFWQIIEKHKVSVFYTAPTAIRTLIKLGAELPQQYDLSSLRLLGSVGEPINPEAWKWYYEQIGKNQCPIVDTWWQTETGANMLAPIPGITSLKAGSCTKPLPGIIAGIVDENGEDIKQGGSGYLVIKKPFPSQLRAIWRNHDRYKHGYYPQDIANGKYYVAGDYAYLDKDGYFWILGRIDDVLNVSGHRLGTMEIESALVRHQLVAEAAVVGKPHELKGDSVCAFVVLKTSIPQTDSGKDELRNELCNLVIQEIGSIAKPDDIRFSDNLPKTRSGKIMRRLLRSIAKGEVITQDTSTLENPAIIEQLQNI